MQPQENLVSLTAEELGDVMTSALDQLAATFPQGDERARALAILRDYTHALVRYAALHRDDAGRLRMKLASATPMTAPAHPMTGAVLERLHTLETFMRDQFTRLLEQRPDDKPQRRPGTVRSINEQIDRAFYVCKTCKGKGRVPETDPATGNTCMDECPTCLGDGAFYCYQDNRADKDRACTTCCGKPPCRVVGS